MAVFTDSPQFAAQVLQEEPTGWWGPTLVDGDIDRWLEGFLREPSYMLRPTDVGRPWSHILLSETSDGSNYDRLIELVRAGTRLPDRLACLAGSGTGFHGFKGRHWSAVPGNIHLSIHLAPHRHIERFEVAFMALAAVSVVEAVDRIPGLAGRAGIRWVNDVVIDGAKLAGVLAYTHARQTEVNSAVLGIGVNVRTRPPVAPTSFVPAVTSLRDHAAPDDARLAPFLRHLLETLDRNYRVLLTRGYRPLVDRYRTRSVVVGREIVVCADSCDLEPRVITRGVVESLGEGLELHLEGRERPVTRGRIIVGDGAQPALPGVAHRRAV